MKLTELVDGRIINLNLVSTNKNDLFVEMGGMLHDAGYVSDLDHFVDALHQREKEFSTGLGFGFGIPHARSKVVNKPAIAIGRCTSVDDYEAFDNIPIRMVLMIAVPENQNDDYMVILSQISRRLMNEEFRNKLMTASSPEEILDLLNKTIK